MAHQKNCADCREAAMLAQALQQDASELATRYMPPSAERVWAAAERHRQMAALARATRFLHILRIAGLVYAVIFALWGLHVLAARGIVAPWLDGKSLNVVMEGAGLAVLFVGSGLWYTLRGERRQAS
ncbi:hypothetical protein H7849_08510 [Alloacidobacterium dinghuense]|uniref:Uncharacterized protein n=1 Tax=Alloacidobacterium dinghuense TaxID=2763107 RepID=A0A7G8BN12_9BACT|nr:hypothetical protein [Alloacidobacterium dinghuense]QNI33932.1 hypothetical protein H7849_08510 [Alloacidobacterium dinghuense]